MKNFSQVVKTTAFTAVGLCSLFAISGPMAMAQAFSSGAQLPSAPERIVLNGSQFGNQTLVQNNGLASVRQIRSQATGVSYEQIRNQSAVLRDQMAKRQVFEGVRARLNTTPGLTPAQRELLLAQAKEILESDGTRLEGGASSASGASGASGSASSASTQTAAGSEGVAPVFTTPGSVALSALPSRLIDLRASLFTSYPDFFSLCVGGHPMGRTPTHWRNLEIQGCISTVIFFSSLTVGAAYRFHLGNLVDGAGRHHEFNAGPQVNLRWAIGTAVGVDLLGSFEYVYWFNPRMFGITATADIGIDLAGRYGWYGLWGDTGFWAIPIFRLMGGIAFR